MKTKKKPIIRLLVFILPALIQLSSFAQGVIKAETGAYIKSETGSYWVVDNGAFTITSPGTTNPASMANLKIEADASLTIGPQSCLYCRPFNVVRLLRLVRTNR